MQQTANSCTIKGYYLSVESFLSQDHNGKQYHIPDKREWGIEPAENGLWVSLDQVHDRIMKVKKEKHSLMCWQKNGDTYSSLFIVWW